MAENIIEKAKRYRAYLEKAVTSLSDEDALEVPSMFKKWGPDMVVEEGDRLYYAPNKTLYKVKPGQGHTTQSDWRPDITPEKLIFVSDRIQPKELFYTIFLMISLETTSMSWNNEVHEWGI